jgi:hypothetical protein
LNERLENDDKKKDRAMATNDEASPTLRQLDPKSNDKSSSPRMPNEAGRG